DSLVDIEDDLDELTDSVEDLTEIVASNEHGNALYINNTGEYLYKAGKTFTVPRSGTLSIVFYKETTGNTIFIERNGVRKLFFANYFSANFYMSLQLNVIKGDEVKVYTDVADTSAENRNYKLIHAIII
ncbi:hypothetical protein, partial [Treponema sp.]|uniref:hypothetical protein n=1 Tax=Treponema sp. TaxID=166 RepID=UPI00298E1077